MKYIANIISKVKVEPFSEFVYVTSDPSFCDYSLPTLIVGWEEAKRRFPDVDILEKHIQGDIYWTFLPRERKYEYEKDYENFKNIVVRKYVRALDYKYFNFFTEGGERCRKVLAYIKSSKATVFVNGDMLYMLLNGGSSIRGYSLRDAEYIGIPKEKVFKFLKGHKFVYGSDFLTNKDKRLFAGNSIIIPYLYYLKYS